MTLTQLNLKAHLIQEMRLQYAHIPFFKRPLAKWFSHWAWVRRLCGHHWEKWHFRLPSGYFLGQHMRTIPVTFWVPGLYCSYAEYRKQLGPHVMATAGPSCEHYWSGKEDFIMATPKDVCPSCGELYHRHHWYRETDKTIYQACTGKLVSYESPKP